MKNETKLVVGGRRPHDFDGAVNMPVVRTSTVISTTLDEWDARGAKGFPGMMYGRLGTTTTRAFEESVAMLEGGAGTVVLPSGLAANVWGMLPFLSNGDHVLMPDNIYGPVRRFNTNRLPRMGVETTYYDPLIGGAIRDLLRPNTRVVYVEGPGSLTFEMPDIPAIAAEAHKVGAKVVMDNTWATPLYFKAFEHGVDVSVQSATKYIVGHSDVLMGTVTTTADLLQQVRECRQDFGQISSPDDVYLAQRGMRTLAVRLERHWKTGLVLADWLAAQPEVMRVIHPAMPGDAGHAIWKRDYLGASGLFTFLLRPIPRAAQAALVDTLQLFGLGASWGGFESLIMPIHPESGRTATRWDANCTGFRVHAGLESVDDLIADLENGFGAMRHALAKAA